MPVVDLQRFDLLFPHQMVLPSFAYLMAGFGLLGPERLSRVLIPVSAALALFAVGAAFAAEMLRFSGDVPLAVFSAIWLAAVGGSAYVLARKGTVWPWWPKIPTSYLVMGCLLAAQVGDIALLSQVGLFENTALFRTFWEVQSATLPAYGLLMLFLREVKPSAHPTFIALFVLVFSGHALVLVHDLDMDKASALAWGTAALILLLYALPGPAAAARAFRILGCAACGAGLVDILLRGLIPWAGLRLYAQDQNFLAAAVPLILLGGISWFVLARREKTPPREERRKGSPVRRAAAAFAACFSLAFFSWYALPLTLADLMIRQGNMQRLAFVLARRGPALLQSAPDSSGADLAALAAAGEPPEKAEPQWRSRLALLERLLVLLDRSEPGADAPLRYFATHEAVSCLSPKAESAPALNSQLGCATINLAFARNALPEALLLAKAFSEKPDCADAADLALGDYRQAPTPYSPAVLGARLRFFRTVGFAFDPERQILDPTAFPPQDPSLPAFVSLLLDAGVAPGALLDPAGLPLLSSPALGKEQRAALEDLLRERKPPSPGS
ncbi:MAG: hypothetical protein LBP61_09825 [Desulfovibrio sp.]|jgi:hypothetical protein|nr:hypothetical protein [Desulfovibrio sp.]